MSKIGRNDPCHCGSGKKYKQCCMKKDKQKEKDVRDAKEAVRFVTRDLLKYARDERFSEDFAKALSLYWNDFYDVENAEEMSMPEAFRFFDWFTYDYQLADGRFLIQIYHEEKYEDLSRPQQILIDEWLNASPASGFELTGYEGQDLQLRDYFSGEEFVVFEPGGRGNVEVGEIILTRIVPVVDHLEFSTTAAYLPADEITDIKEKMETAENAFKATNPEATYEDFMRQKNYLLVHHALAEAERVGRPPVARLDANREDTKTQTVARQMKRFKR